MCSTAVTANDTLIGGAAASLLKGGAGDDHLNGGSARRRCERRGQRLPLRPVRPHDQDLHRRQRGRLRRQERREHRPRSQHEHRRCGNPRPHRARRSAEHLHEAEPDPRRLGHQDDDAPPIFSDVFDYAHMIVVDNIDSVGTILGGNGADTFFISQTRNAGTFTTLLNGQGGNDTYDFLHFGSGSKTFTPTCNDTGNPWDSGDQIVVDGSSGADSITSPATSPAATSPAAAARRALRRPGRGRERRSRSLVNGNDGVDNITVESTSATVPVKVDGGLGDDIVTVGNGVGQRHRRRLEAGPEHAVRRRPGRRRRRRRSRHARRQRQHRRPAADRHARVVDRGAPDGAGRHRGRRGRRPRHEALRERLRHRTQPCRAGPCRVRGRRGADRAARHEGQHVHDRRRRALLAAAAGASAEGVLLRPVAGRADDDPGRRRGRHVPDRLDGRSSTASRSTPPTGSSPSRPSRTASPARSPRSSTSTSATARSTPTNSFTLTFTAADGTTQTPGTCCSPPRRRRCRPSCRRCPTSAAATSPSPAGAASSPSPSRARSATSPRCSRPTSASSSPARTTTQGCDGASGCGVAANEVQHLKVDSTTTGGNGYFTVTMGFQETKALPLNVCASGPNCLDAAIKAAFTDINASGTLVSVTAERRRLRRRVLERSPATSRRSIPTLMPLYVDGGAGTDQLDVQSIFEDMYFNGGAEQRQREREHQRARRSQRSIRATSSATSASSSTQHGDRRATTRSSASRSRTPPAAPSSSASAASSPVRSPGTRRRRATASPVRPRHDLLQRPGRRSPSCRRSAPTPTAAERRRRRGARSTARTRSSSSAT